jgi:geranylgeranyl reductase
MLETNILIVGGGPAGATVAKYLSLSNIPNILIQKKLNFKKPCGGGIRLDAFDEFNLDKKIISSYVDKIILSFKEKKITVDISDTPLAIIERRTFDNYLRDEAVAEGSILYEAKLIDLEIRDNHIVSKVKFKNEIKFIKSKYLIASDGVNSTIRKRINGDKVSSLLTNYSNFKNSTSNDCEFHFGSNIADKYYAWVFPENNGTNIGTLASRSKPYMKNLINSLQISEKSKVYGYNIPEFNNNIFYKDRVFFVGDSASQVLPFTYEGIYYAMSSAKILSEVIIKDLDPSAYEKEWNRRYLKKFNTIQKLQKIFLYNDFMISIMMKLYRYETVRRQMIGLWLGDKDIDINFKFFVKVIKKIF